MRIFNRLFFFGSLLITLSTSISSTTLDFIPCSDPRLNQPSQMLTKEEITSDKIKELIHQMLVMSGHESDPNQTGKKSILVGLAAPQVGVMKQIIIIDPRSLAELKSNQGKSQFDILINPTITWQSNELDCSYEGCYSVPEKYIGIPKRPTAIEVEALDREGTYFQKRYEGSAAYVVQHEIDHLRGVRFPERLKSEKELHLLKDDAEIAKYRKNWKTWKNHATLEEWQEMKKGEYSL